MRNVIGNKNLLQRDKKVKYKEIVNEKTQTRVEHLNKDRQIMEIARLLSGEKITQNSINMAKDLLFTKQ